MPPSTARTALRRFQASARIHGGWEDGSTHRLDLSPRGAPQSRDPECLPLSPPHRSARPPKSTDRLCGPPQSLSRTSCQSMQIREWVVTYNTPSYMPGREHADRAMYPSNVVRGGIRLAFKLLSAHLTLDNDRGSVWVGSDCGWSIAHDAKSHRHYDPALVQPGVVEPAKVLRGVLAP